MFPDLTNTHLTLPTILHLEMDACDGKLAVFINLLGYISHLSVHVKLDVSLACEEPVESVEVVV